MKLFELGEHFPGICNSFFLEIDGPAPEPAVFQSTCSVAPLSPIWERRSGWVSMCSSGGRTHKTARAHRRLRVYIQRNKATTKMEWVRFCRHEVTDSPVTNCI